MMVGKMLRPASAGGALMALVLVLAACGSSKSSSTSGGSTGSSPASTASAPASTTSNTKGPLSGKKIVFSECCQDPQFTQAWEPGIRAAINWSKSGASLQVINANGDNTQQLSQIEGLIGQGVNGIMTVTESGTGYGPLVTKAQAAGITYANYSGNPAPGAKFNIIYPHYQAGYILGVSGAKWLQQTQGGKGAIGVTVNPTDPGLTSRTNGFIAGAKSVIPNIKVDKGAAPAGSLEVGNRVASEMLQANPDIKVLFCYNETLALGCVTGAQQVGRSDPKGLLISSADAGPTGLKAVAKGGPTPGS